ncbi:MAG: hypothetical protein ACFHU9_13140 [Fluviicola sp.]
MHKIEATTPSSQVFSPGFSINFGRGFLISESFGYFLNSNLNWSGGGVAWRENELDLRVKSAYNNLRFEFEGGVTLFPLDQLRLELGLNNSFGVKLDATFAFSEQGTVRNWAPMIVTRLIYQTDEQSKWSFGVSANTGLRTIHFVQAINTNSILRYESSHDHATVFVRRAIR